jgi:hypothetical protein
MNFQAIFGGSTKAGNKVCTHAVHLALIPARTKRRQRRSRSATPVALAASCSSSLPKDLSHHRLEREIRRVARRTQTLEVAGELLELAELFDRMAAHVERRYRKAAL